ncbi:hypothetical protein T439DRAFT_360989 [Meredithblackwellia eburnea MCA 4105]
MSNLPGPPTSLSFTSLEPYVARKHAQSCLPCRTRKVKCDLEREGCRNCKRRRDACVYPNTAPPSGILSGPPQSAHVQRVFAPPQRMFTLPNAQSPARVPVSAARSPPTVTSLASAANSPRSGDPTGVKLHEELDHSILLGPSPSQSASPAGIRSPQASSPVVYGSGSGFPFRADARSLLSSLPDKDYCDSIVTLYLERVEWIHKPLHVPTFLATYNSFWSYPASDRHNADPKWLGLLFIVLCLGLHFAETTPSLPGLTASEAEEQFCQACQQALAQANFLSDHSIEHIQTIICLNLYLNNTDRSPMAHMMLGVAIKMALALGLSRIPPENEAPREGSLGREIGRRLWWSLVCQDAYTSSACNSTYLVVLGQTSTQLPSNVDDEDLIEGRSIVGKPITEPTNSSFHITKIDFALATRKYIDLINNTSFDYDAILALDREYRDIYADLPTYLRPDVPQPLSVSSTFRRQHLVWERIFSGITLQNRIMRLHRAYMSRGYKEELFRFSTDACLTAAHGCLDLVEKARISSFPGSRWWVVLVHIWTAGLVIAMDLLQDSPTGSPTEASRKRAGVELSISLLRHASRFLHRF